MAFAATEREFDVTLSRCGVFSVSRSQVQEAMESLPELVTQARAGHRDAFGRLVSATQAMAYAVARGVVRDVALAQDAVQESYLAAFRRLGDLEEPAAFPGWLRRIVITVSLN